MVKQLLGLCLLAATCFGQAYTYRDQAFLGAKPVQPQYPFITDNLVLHLKVNNEGSGTNVTDYSSYGLDATLRGAQYSQLQWSKVAPYGNGWALAFPEGSGAYIRSVTNDIYNLYASNKWSMAFWSCRTNATTCTGPFPWLYNLIETDGTFQTTPLNAYIDFRFDCNYNSLDFYHFGDPGVVNLSYKPLTNVWQYWCVVRDGTAYSVYLNGGYRTTYANGYGAYQNTNSPAVAIGFAPKGGNNNHGWSGYIGDVAMWRGKALTAAEVKYLYYTYFQQSYKFPDEGLAAYWKFNEGSGTAITDYGPYHLNAYLTNRPGSANIPQWITNGYHKTVIDVSNGGLAYSPTNVLFRLNGTNRWSVAFWAAGFGYGAEMIRSESTAGNYAWDITYDAVYSRGTLSVAGCGFAIMTRSTGGYCPVDGFSVLTYDGSKYDYYNKGVWMNSYILSGTRTVGNYPRIAWNTAIPYWYGWVGETIVWSGYALNASEVSDMYHLYYGY